MTPQQILSTPDLIAVGVAGDEVRRALRGRKTTFVRVLEMHVDAPLQGLPPGAEPGEIRVIGAPASIGAAVDAVRAAAALPGSAPAPRQAAPRHRSGAVQSPPTRQHAVRRPHPRASRVARDRPPRSRSAGFWEPAPPRRGRPPPPRRAKPDARRYGTRRRPSAAATPPGRHRRASRTPERTSSWRHACDGEFRLR